MRMVYQSNGQVGVMAAAIEDKYRRLTLSLPPTANRTTDAAIAALNSRFNADDFYLARNDGVLEVWLRQVNLGDLSQALDRAASQHDSREMMREVYRAVESVRSYGINGNKRLYVGYNDERKVVGRREKEHRRGKHFYANDHSHENANRRLPPDFANRVICGDSEEVLRELPDNCVDLVFTSPPYNFGLRYEASNIERDADRSIDGDIDGDANRSIDGDANRNANRDADGDADGDANRSIDRDANRNADGDANRDANRHANGDANRGAGGDATDWDGYFSRLFAVFDECIRVLKYGGRIVVNVQPLFSDYIPSHHIISSFFMERRLIWKGEILWEKNNYNCKYTAWGSWKSPSSPYLKYTWEFLEVFCKGDLRKPGQAANADIDADSFKKWVLAKWSIAPERRMSEFKHPAMFPEELARRVMLLFSFRGDTVVDPFNGVGTTSVVAHQNGRKFLGVDIAPEYCAAAKARLSRAQLQAQIR